jgi:hypothetical protein
VRLEEVTDLGVTLPSSEANMLVYGCVPHSGPSSYVPVTGTPAWFGYLAARNISGLCETMPNALESASCTAVLIWDGLVWSSITKGTSLCPSTPPSAFWRSRRASKPAGEVAFSDPPSPVRSVT